MFQNWSSRTSTRRIGHVLADLIYLAGVCISLFVGAYGIYLVLITVVASPSFWVVGVMFGLPMVIASSVYLGFVFRLLFLPRLRKQRYSAWIVAIALISAILIGLFGYWVTYALRGL